MNMNSKQHGHSTNSTLVFNQKYHTEDTMFRLSYSYPSNSDGSSSRLRAGQDRECITYPCHSMQSSIPSESEANETLNIKIDYELVRRCLIYGSADEKCEVLDAVRSRITASESSNVALNTIHEILHSDLLRISCICDEKSLLEDLLWPKNVINPHKLQISMARLLNVLVSYKIGREYFNKKSIIQLLIWDDPERAHIEQEMVDNLIDVMFKLSLNRFQCADMIKKGLLIWMVCHMAEVLMAEHFTAKCHIESMTGLLRMLLSEDSAFICFDIGFIDVKNFILLLVRYLEMDNEIVKRNIYACLLAMLKKPAFVEIAKEINIAKIIKEHIELMQNQSQLCQQAAKLAVKESIQDQDSNKPTLDLYPKIDTDANIHLDSQNQDNRINNDAGEAANVHIKNKNPDISQEINDEVVSLRLAEYEFGSNETQKSTSTGRLASNLKLTQEGLEKLRASKLKSQLKHIENLQVQSLNEANILKGGDTEGTNFDMQRQPLEKIGQNTYNLSRLSPGDVKKNSKLVEQKHMQAIYELLTQSDGCNDLLDTLETRLDENELYSDGKMDFNDYMKAHCHPVGQFIREKFGENQEELNSSFIPEYNLEHDGPFLSRIFVERVSPKIEGNRIFPMLHFRSVNRSERTCIRFYETTSISGPHHMYSPNASKIILPRWKEFQSHMFKRYPNAQTIQIHSADQYSANEKLSNEAEIEESSKPEDNFGNDNLPMKSAQLQGTQSSQIQENQSSQLQVTQSSQLQENQSSELQGTQSFQLQESQSSTKQAIQIHTTELRVYENVQENDEQNCELQTTISNNASIQQPASPCSYPLGKRSSSLASPSSEKLENPDSHLQGSLQENQLLIETTKAVEEDSCKENFVQKSGVNKESHFSPLQGSQYLQLQESQSIQKSELLSGTANRTVKEYEKNEEQTYYSYQKNNDEVPSDDEGQNDEINNKTVGQSTQQAESTSSQKLEKSSSQPICPSTQLPGSPPLILQENILTTRMTETENNEIIQNVQEYNKQTYELNPKINEVANVPLGHRNVPLCYHNEDIAKNDNGKSPSSVLNGSKSSQVQAIHSLQLPRSQSMDIQGSKLPMQTSELVEKENSQLTLDLQPKVFPRSREDIVPLCSANQDDRIKNIQENDEQISDLFPKISENAHTNVDNDHDEIIEDTISSSLQKSGSPSSQLQQNKLRIEMNKVVEEENDKEHYEETSDLHFKVEPGSSEFLVQNVINDENRSQVLPLPLKGTQSLRLPDSHRSQLQVTQSLGPIEMPTEKANHAIKENNDIVISSSQQPKSPSSLQRRLLSPVQGSKSLQTNSETAKENENINKQASVPYFSSANSSFERNVKAVYDSKEYTDTITPGKLKTNLKKTEDGLEHLLSMKRENDILKCIGNEESEIAKHIDDESPERQSVNKNKEVVIGIIEDMASVVNNDNLQKESSSDEKSAVTISSIAQKPSGDEIPSKDNLLTVDQILNNEKLVDFFCEKMISKIAARNDFCGPNCGSTCGGLNKSKVTLKRRDQNADDAASSCCEVQDTKMATTNE